MKQAYRVTVKGRVTGVCFRYFTEDYAHSLLGVTGYVRNSGYGEVEVFVQGSVESVNEMLAWLRHGPPSASVDSYYSEKVEEDSALHTFTIKY